MGQVKKVLARVTLPDRQSHNGRMFIDLCENIHIHYRELRVVFSLDEYFEFADILTRSTEDVRNYLAQNPDYEEGVYPTTIMIAGGKMRQGKLLQNSPEPHRSTYFPNDFAIELQDESVTDEIHVHWRDYRLVMPREHLKLIATALADAKHELEAFEAENAYQQRPHRDRTTDEIARKRAKYADYQTHIMGEVTLPITEIHPRYGKGGKPWTPNDDAIRHLVDCYSKGRAMVPIVLSTETDGKHQVIDGHHRLLAAKRAGLNELNCIVTDMTFADSDLLRKAESVLKAFDEDTGYRYNTSGFIRHFFAYHTNRYYKDHFHGLRLSKPRRSKANSIKAKAAKWFRRRAWAQYPARVKTKIKRLVQALLRPESQHG